MNYCESEVYHIASYNIYVDYILYLMVYEVYATKGVLRPSAW